MISLKPVLHTPSRKCPSCRAPLTAGKWLIPGMRNVAEMNCEECGREFFGDLPSGQGLYTPVLLDKETGSAIVCEQAPWFSDWFTNSFAQRNSQPLGFEVRQFSPLKNKIVLLNCLDTLYGHSLLKLLNAQYYIDYKPDTSLVLLVPSFLEWMLPEGVSEAWVIDLPLRRGTEWNDWLANEISQRLEATPDVSLSLAFSHPHTDSFDIERFTRVKPFALENFDLEIDPVVTFIWRGDRVWESEDAASATRIGRIKRRFRRPEEGQGQTQKIIRFAECLRIEYPELDFAVAGIGELDRLPKWISDLRLPTLNAASEISWCERYAKSHLVVGVHGSNMLLPSAHAGGVIELISDDRWGNYLQDMLLRRSDPREMLFLYRFVPHFVQPEVLSTIASTMLRYKDFRRLMSPEFCKSKDEYDFKELQSGREL